MKTKMLKTLPGSEDGIHVQDYVAGQEYEMGESLAKAFIGCGAAIVAKEEEKKEQKKSKGPNENK